MLLKNSTFVNCGFGRRYLARALYLITEYACKEIGGGGGEITKVTNSNEGDHFNET